MRRIKDIPSLSKYVVILVSIGAYLSFAAIPRLSDVAFGRGIYHIIRSLYDYTLGQSPVPLFYIVLPLMVLYLGLAFKARSGTKRWVEFLLRIGVLISLFYWLWGFNYLRPTVKKRLSLEPPAVDTMVLRHFYTSVIDSAGRSKSLMRDTVYDLETAVRTATERWMDEYGLDVPGQPRIRSLRPGGILLGMSTAGVYFPYAIECHVDAGLHRLILPFIMAHEVAHGFGVTDEGECNFIGAMACVSSGHPALSYAGFLQMIRWSYVALRRAGYEEEVIYAMLPQTIQSDLKDIREKHDSYPRYFPEKWRDAIYERYLKAQGVSSGLSSYGEALGLILSVWELNDHSETQH